MISRNLDIRLVSPIFAQVGVVSVFLETASQHQPDSARSGEMNIFDWGFNRFQDIVSLCVHFHLKGLFHHLHSDLGKLKMDFGANLAISRKFVRETEMENAMGKGQRAWVSSLLCNSMWFTSVLFEHAQGKHEFKSTLVQGLEGVHEVFSVGAAFAKYGFF